MHRAYALLSIKAIDAERRVFSGMASTPDLDRQGHVVDPAGVRFTNPVPLLLHHHPEKPVGKATLTTTREGIAFDAELPFITEPGPVKDEVDRAWQSVKAGLIKGVSIGYQMAEGAVERLKGGGLKLLQIEVFELSLVTVPANAHATIRLIKSLDLAASGLHPPGATGSLPVVRAEKGALPMTIPEQITQFEATRAAKAARMNALMATAAETNVTLDDAQTEEYDTLTLEVKSVDAHLVRMRALEQTNIAGATRIVPVTEVEKAAALRSGVAIGTVKSNLPKGTAFTRYAMAIAATRGNKMEAIEYAKQWRESTPEVELVLKAAIAPGTTTDATWAGPLAALQPLATEFIDLLRPATILGKIPGLRKVPFNVSVQTQTGGGTYQWVGQGAAKPVTSLAFGTSSLGIAKAAGIIVLTEELVRVSSPSAEERVRNDMIKGIAQFLDSQFVLPAVAEVVGTSPASITNGTTPLVSAGTSAANGRTDLIGLFGSVLTANGDQANLVILMSQTNAMTLGASLNALGQPLFPNLGPNGGSFMGIPVITSQALGANVILLDAQGILFADDGQVMIDVSREASLQMDSAPDNPADGDTVLVSLWQNNLVGLRAERWINWKRATLASVKYVAQTYV